jgi:hypothetical protein
MRKQSLSDSKSTGQGSPTLVIRGIDPALRSALEAERTRLGTSLNAVVLRILRSSLGLTETAGLHHDLDALAGAWSREETEEFVRSTEQFEEIDPALWAPGPADP